MKSSGSFPTKADPSSYHTHSYNTSADWQLLWREKLPPETLHFDVPKQGKQLSYQTFGDKQTDKIELFLHKDVIDSLLETDLCSDRPHQC